MKCWLGLKSMLELRKPLKCMEPRLMLPSRRSKKIKNAHQGGRILKGVDSDPRLYPDAGDSELPFGADNPEVPKGSGAGHCLKDSPTTLL